MISSSAAPTGWPRFSLCVMTMLLLCISCHCHRETTWVGHPGYQVPNDSLYPLKNQVIVWKNPKSSEAEFQQWLTDLKRQRPTVQALAVCSHCDSDMLLLYDTSLLPYLQGQTVGGSGGSTGGGPSGGSGPTLFCGNYRLNARDSGYSRIEIRKRFPSTINLPWLKPKASGALTIAVFDTGLDSVGTTAVATVPSTCFDLPPGASSTHGWNFCYNNSNTADDMPDKHGTKVTKMIMDQVQLYGGHDVNILPVKIFDSTGRGTLFGMLCSIAYASGAGAKIINASFGFYHCQETDTSNTVKIEHLMDVFLDKYLTSNGMLMIAAAGNEDAQEDAIYHQLTGGTAYRNLDSNRFYPACFARTHSNIIAVTTVSQQTQKPSPMENASMATVDAGANCDTIAGGIYVFYDPTTPPTSTGGGYVVYTVTGSSFATPVVTGRIAAMYNSLTSKTDKQVIIPAMNTTASGRVVLVKDKGLGFAVVNGEVAP